MNHFNQCCLYFADFHLSQLVLERNTGDSLGIIVLWTVRTEEAWSVSSTVFLGLPSPPKIGEGGVDAILYIRRFTSSTVKWQV